MNLDLDTLREMISSTLQEITTESLDSTKPEEDATEEIEAAVEKLKQDTEKEKQQLAKKAADEAADEAAEIKRQKNLSSSPPLEESFQITKGRLRQIIAEELISAKKQGIL